MGNKRYKYLYDQLKRVGVSSESIIIDCACGVGIGTKILMDKGWKNIFAYDISYQNILKAHERGIRVTYADICSMPCDSNYADVFICAETLEHIAPGESTQMAIREIKRTCKDDGIICITVPSDVKKCMANKKHKQYLSVEDIENLFDEYIPVFKGQWCKKTDRCNNVILFKGKKYE